MAQPHQDDFDRLRAEAVQARLQAIQTQLAVGLTLCAMAEIEIIHGEMDEARKLVERLLHSTEVIRFHLDEPNHVPPSSLPDLRNQLAQLKNRIRNVEMQLRTT